MKLAKIAVATVVVLGAVVTGGSWYTGKQLEQHYNEWVSVANKNLQSLTANYGIPAEIKNVKIERHLFSSDVRYDVETQAVGFTETFQGQSTIYHGPIPLNRLVKGKMMPMMVSITADITTPESLKSMVESSDFFRVYSISVIVRLCQGS